MMRILVLILMMAWPAFSQQVGNVTANKLRGGTLPTGCNAGPPPDVFVQTGTPPIVYICGPSNTWNALVGGGSGITGSLTSGRVAIASGTTTLTTDADLTFATDTLTATKIVGSTSITDSGLTAGRVTFAGTGGLLSDNAGFLFDSTTALTDGFEKTIELSRTYTAAAMQTYPRGIALDLTTTSSAGVASLTNINSTMTFGSTVSGNAAFGIQNRVSFTGDDADAIIVGIYSQASMSPGMTDASVIHAGEFQAGAGSGNTVAELTGIWVKSLIDSATVTTQIGIDIEDISGAMSNFAIRTGAGQLKFGNLTTTGAAGSKKVVCVDTSTGILYASSSDTACAN